MKHETLHRCNSERRFLPFQEIWYKETCCSSLTHTYEERGEQKLLFSLALAFKRQDDTQWLNTYTTHQHTTQVCMVPHLSNVIICWLEKNLTHVQKPEDRRGAKVDVSDETAVLEWKQPERREKGGNQRRLDWTSVPKTWSRWGEREEMSENRDHWVEGERPNWQIGRKRKTVFQKSLQI